MWHLTRLAVRSRIVTALLALVVAGVSIWAFLGMKVELLPNISFPYTTVVTVYPRATPDAVVAEVTAPIERLIMDQWSGKGLKRVVSTSTSGMSMVMAEFEFGTDMTAVGKRLDKGVSELTLPQAVIDFPKMMGSNSRNPQIIPINMSMLPLVILSLSGDLPQEQLREIADAQVVPVLAQIEGVLRVDREGGEKDQIVVAPDPQKMNRYGVSMARIVGLLGSEYSSLDDVGATPLGTDGVMLSDVARVSKSPPPLSAITRTNGRPSVGISVVKTDTANTVDTANAVHAKIKALRPTLGEGVTISTVFDQSNFIQDSIKQLWEKAVVGGVLAIIVVYVFLLAIRPSLLTAISIPLSLFIGFLCMRITGITINVLTLMAMALAVGRLIDDSIVMVEVIFRRLRRGEDFKEAAIGGAKEVATPISAATLATVAIFIPLIFVGGIVGELFVPFALTVTFAMLSSLLVALTVIPALSRLLVSARRQPKVASDNWYQSAYARALRWTLGHRVTVVVIAVVMLVASTGLLAVTGTSFMSGAMREPMVSVQIVLPSTADINDTSAAAARVEALLSENPAVKRYRATIGTSATSMSGIMSAARGGGGANTASIAVYLKPEEDPHKQASAIDRACRGILENGHITVSADTSGGAGFSASSLSLSIQGQDQEKIAEVAAQLLERLGTVNGIADLKSDLTTVVPRLNIALDPVKVAAAGLSAAQMGQLQQEFILLMNGGTVPGKTVTLDNTSYPIYVRGITQNLTDAEQARNLKIGLSRTLTLNDIASVAIVELPSHISRTDGTLSATITGTITDKDVGAVNREVQKQVRALPPHDGVKIVTAGIAEEMGQTFSRMFIAIAAAVVIVFLIVMLTMRSIANPLIIMVSLPLAFIGSVPALLISGHTLGVSALMGLLMLVGIVLTNAVVLVSMVEQLRRNGASVQDAVMEGAKTRLRPILMTALTTILAMVPMAMFVSSGTVLGAELAVVVIGGLTSSTFLTLFVIPAIYSLVHRRNRLPVAK